MATFRFPVFGIDGKAVAEINAYTADIKAGGEQQMGAEGVLGISDGIFTVDIKATSVCPIGGHTVDLVDLLFTRKEFASGIEWNGGFYAVPMKCVEGSIKTQSKDGSVTGDWTFKNSGNPAKMA